MKYPRNYRYYKSMVNLYHTWQEGGYSCALPSSLIGYHGDFHMTPNDGVL